MTYLTHFSLQQSIYEKLSADSALSTLVAGVYDHVPQGTQYPFVTIAESRIQDFSTLETPGTECEVAIRVFSREAGRKQSAIIMERITALLHHATLTISGHTLVSSRFLSSTIILDDDGLTYRGTMLFGVWMREQ